MAVIGDFSPLYGQVAALPMITNLPLFHLYVHSFALSRRREAEKEREREWWYMYVSRKGTGKLICRVDVVGSYCHLWSLSVRELEAGGRLRETSSWSVIKISCKLPTDLIKIPAARTYVPGAARRAGTRTRRLAIRVVVGLSFDGNTTGLFIVSIREECPFRRRFHARETLTRTSKIYVPILFLVFL